MSKRYSKESNLKISKILTGHIVSETTRKKIQNKIKRLWKNGHYNNRKKRNLNGKNNPMYGKSGKLCPAWNGGKSFESYTLKFNIQLKKRIKERDENKCQMVGCENKIKLCIHHIDYNKKNDSDINLLALCRRHNNRANFDRSFWQKLFQNYQNLRLEFGAI